MKKEFPKNIEKRPCKICGQKRSYTIPLDTCYECKGRFCYQHISGGQVTDKMGQGEPIRDICDLCIKGSEYHSLSV